MAKEEKPKSKPAVAPAPVKTGHDVLWELVGGVLALLFLANAFSGSSIFKTLTGSDSPSSQKVTLQGIIPATNDSSNGVPAGDATFLQGILSPGDANLLSAGKLANGTEVIDKGLIQVRREPGGSVIGLQKRGERGTVIDGPVNAYGARWWMVNYENTPSGWVSEGDITTKFFWYYVVNFFPNLWDYWKTISYILSGFFACVILYVLIKQSSVPLYDEDSGDAAALPEKKKTVSKKTALLAEAGVEQRIDSNRWERVELLMKSHNPNDWRQAIIEADVMLDDMLEHMGYEGTSIGEKLKNVDENDFKTLDKAWEAHKVRNRLAHDASGYKFSYDEAFRTVGLYKDVFSEFYWS